MVFPVAGEALLLNLSVGENSMGSLLDQMEMQNGKEQSIYYLSKKFLEYETRYTPLETYTTLVWATRRLQQYMVAYSVQLISRMDPIKYLFGKPALTSRQLDGYCCYPNDITYVTQKSIKGQAVSDHLAAHPTEDERILDDAFPYEEIATAKEETTNEW
ncbi:uncharacterized protein LOC122084731 [Macadamia integrifolia]|uniref:uncharacterized protein LOC122084731 n=1 Tax=Macadamia integrifolia TaxID=60698 RepID=UPI001C4EB250|nr:uncharacterized protein LOC122084731 [Macadamia integrifolia]